MATRRADVLGVLEVVARATALQRFEASLAPPRIVQADLLGRLAAADPLPMIARAAAWWGLDEGGVSRG
jgi:hypothetical protein